MNSHRPKRIGVIVTVNPKAEQIDADTIIATVTDFLKNLDSAIDPDSISVVPFTATDTRISSEEYESPSGNRRMLPRTVPQFPAGVPDMLSDARARTAYAFFNYIGQLPSGWLTQKNDPIASAPIKIDEALQIESFFDATIKLGSPGIEGSGHTMPTGSPGANPGEVEAQPTEEQLKLPYEPQQSRSPTNQTTYIYVLDTINPNWGNTVPKPDYIMDEWKVADRRPKLWSDFEAQRPSDHKRPMGHDFNVLYDHGSFVADIIYRASGNMHITMVEVMNKYMVGTLEVLVEMLKVVVDEINKRIAAAPANSTTVHIINMSFACKHRALRTALQQIWDQAFADGIVTHDEQWMLFIQGIIADVLRRAKVKIDPTDAAALSAFCGLLDTLRTLGDIRIVAAAGNDSKLNQKRVVTTFPAAVPGIYGVGGKDGHKKTATYSNFPDTIVPKGFMVLGEFYGPFTNHQPMWRINDENKVETYQITSNYAIWRGTSFASALLTGLLAAEVQAGNDIASAVDNLRKIVLKDPEVDLSYHPYG